jgi:hypothetical protein
MDEEPTQIQRLVQIGITLAIYGLIMWLIWTIITGIADSRGSHLFGMFLAGGIIVLMLPAKWVYDRVKDRMD